MSHLRVLIVDDEPAAREGLRLRIETHSDVEVVGECGSASQALERIEQDQPDLLFLDVEMPGMSGIEMLERMPAKEDLAVVLVTAYSEFALKAFEVNVIDYLLKPIDDRRFEVALERARRHHRRVRSEQLARQMKSLVGDDPDLARHGATGSSSAVDRASTLRRFLVRRNGSEVALDVEVVSWIEAAGDYVRLHTLEGEFMIRDTLSHLERKLSPSFGRVHRSALVRFDQVQELRRTAYGDYAVVLHNGNVLRMSRTYRQAFREGLQTAVVDG